MHCHWTKANADVYKLGHLGLETETETRCADRAESWSYQLAVLAEAGVEPRSLGGWWQHSPSLKVHEQLRQKEEYVYCDELETCKDTSRQRGSEAGDRGRQRPGEELLLWV